MLELRLPEYSAAINLCFFFRLWTKKDKQQDEGLIGEMKSIIFFFFVCVCLWWGLVIGFHYWYCLKGLDEV